MLNDKIMYRYRRLYPHGLALTPPELSEAVEGDPGNALITLCGLSKGDRVVLYYPTPRAKVLMELKVTNYMEQRARLSTPGEFTFAVPLCWGQFSIKMIPAKTISQRFVERMMFPNSPGLEEINETIIISAPGSAT